MKYILIALIAATATFSMVGMAGEATTGAEVVQIQQDTVYRDNWFRGGWTRCSSCAR
jgi:hypothetical protein